MSTYTSPIREWAGSLRNLSIGASVASFFLLPDTNYPIVVIEQQLVKSEGSFVVPSTRSLADSRPLFEARSSHLETPPSQRVIHPTNDESDLNSIPYLLREMSGLPVETLASLADVSRNAYYKWLDGGGVSNEHAKRLIKLLDTFRTIRDVRGPALKEFLLTTSSIGRPVDLLVAGKHDAVSGLAFRPLSTHIDSDSVSKAARDISGLPGWTRPARRLNWGAPRLSGVERDRALERLNPRPQLIHDEPFDNEENDEAFIAWGFVWE